MFKYMPYRRVFFDNFLIRASQRVSLNDPFEVLPSKKWLEKAYFERYEKDSEKDFDNLVKEMTRMNLNNMGMISLTEKSNNLLMWSHYADEHRGMVIEIDENNETLKRKFDYDKSSPVTKKVEYCQNRVNEYKFDDMYLPYQYKFDDWKYEAEHRIIVKNLFSCDCWMIVFNNKTDAKQAYEKKQIDGISINKSINNCILKDNIITFETRDIEQRFDPNLIFNNPRFMSMYAIPREAIKTVIFGMKSKQEDIKEILEHINNKPALNHIKVKQAKLSESKFDLDFESL